MAEPTINEYCPPPEPGDYLEGEIGYPTPEGKEWQESRNPRANDLLIEPDKKGKTVSISKNIKNYSSLRVLKRTRQLPSRLETRSRKRSSEVSQVFAFGKTSNSLVLSAVSSRKRGNAI